MIVSRVELGEIQSMRDVYRHEMHCQIIFDSVHIRPGWSHEYLITRAIEPSAGRPEILKKIGAMTPERADCLMRELVPHTRREKYDPHGAAADGFQDFVVIQPRPLRFPARARRRVPALVQNPGDDQRQIRGRVLEGSGRQVGQDGPSRAANAASQADDRPQGLPAQRVGLAVWTRRPVRLCRLKRALKASLIR